jgi:uracil-DNA glycosylase family 4
MPERLTTNIVGPDGPLDAKICFIGQSPGAEEDNAGRPFVGAAGQLLNRCLQQQGIPRTEVLCNNVFAQRPPKNDAGYYYENKSKTKPTWEGQQHIDRLRDWLTGLNPRPNVLVALGYEALHTLTGRRRVWKWRGSVLPCTLVPGYKVYAALHPSHVNRLINEQEERLMGEKKSQAQNALPLFLKDLERIKFQSDFPDIRYPERKIHTSLSYHELCSRLEALNEQSLDTAVDIETLYGVGGPILWCIGFSSSPDEAFVVPFLKHGKLAWPVAEEGHLLVLISRFFLNPRAKKIFQNGLYDLSILGRYYGLRVADGTYEDTMYCHHASYPYLKKGLEVLASIYTWEPYYKDEGKVNYGKRSGDEAEFIYNGKDCCTTREIWSCVERDAKELHTWTGYRRSMSIMPSLLSMMIRGVKIDTKMKAHLGVEFKQNADYHLKQVQEKEGEKINLNSPPQLKKLLYYKYNLPEQRNRKTGKVTTDKDALQKLKRKYPGHEILNHILEFRKYSKLASTYTSMETEEDGRVRTAYSLVSTWRLNSRESAFGGGGNLQNIPVRTEEGRMVRRLFIPDEGKILLASDLSQAEARVVAWEAEDIKKIELFLDPSTDVHWENAKIIFKIPKEVPYAPKALFKDQYTRDDHTLKEYRDIGKTVVHASNYGMGPVMLQTILARQGFIFELRTCRGLLEGYISRNPAITEWHRKIREQVRAYRTMVSSFGRKRVFLGRFNDNLWRACYAFSPQNTVGEMLQVSIQRIWDELEYVEPLLNVHDEIVCQIFPEDLPRAIPDIRERMEIPLIIHNRNLTIPCDFKSGPSWGQLKEIEE